MSNATTSPAAPRALGLLGAASRKRALPGTRAIAGAILVGIAVMGTYAASSGMLGDSSHSVVVASRDLSPGTQLTASDVRVETAELSSNLVGNTIGQASVVIGTTVTGPVKAGEILQPGALVNGSASTGPEMSFSLPSSRALNGNLQSGETVDVLVTDKSAPSVAATTAVKDVRIIKVGGEKSALGDSGDLTVTVGLQSRAEAAALAAAVDTGNVTLVRTTALTTKQ